MLRHTLARLWAHKVPPIDVDSECFIANCVYTVVSINTRCIDSNLESGRYISRVGRAGRFLSL